jgi:hypothetical protein
MRNKYSLSLQSHHLLREYGTFSNPSQALIPKEYQPVYNFLKDRAHDNANLTVQEIGSEFTKYVKFLKKSFLDNKKTLKSIPEDKEHFQERFECQKRIRVLMDLLDLLNDSMSKYIETMKKHILSPV